MGGLGSGRETTYLATTSTAQALTVREALEMVGALPSSVAVEVRLTAGEHQTTVRLVAHAQPFGGVRWWWACPWCGRRRAALYRLRGSPWGCRACLRLTYASRRESAYHRSRRRLDRVGRRLGLAPGEADDWGAECPARPPRMRWRTYERLEAAWDAAQRRGWAAVLGDMRRVGVPVDDLLGLTK